MSISTLAARRLAELQQLARERGELVSAEALASVRAPTFRGAAAALQAWRGGELMISGPAETGKTWGALWYVDNFMRAFPGAQGSLLRKVRADLVPTVWQTYRKVAALRGMPAVYGGERPEHVTYANGSRLWLGGVDDPGKSLSGERDIIYVNQAEQLIAHDWETLTTRATGRGAVAPYTVMLGDCNPDAGDHWILKRATAGALTLLHSKHEDNPTLFDEHGVMTEQGRRTMATLEALTGVRKQRLRYGLWVGAEGQYFDMWDADTHVIDAPRQIPADWIAWCAFDYGWQHPMSFGVYVRTGDGDVIKLGEHVERKLSIKRMHEAMLELLDRLGIKRSRLRKQVAGHDLWESKAGLDDDDPLTLAQHFERLGWRFTKANVARIAGAHELAQRLGDVHHPERPTRPTFYVDRRCVRTIATIPAMVADPGRPEDVKKVDADPLTGEGGDDAYDETRYALMEYRLPQLTMSAGDLAGAGVRGWSVT